MNASLDHLPQRKRDELAKVVALIRERIAASVPKGAPAAEEPEMIILFGSYARGDWREERDLPPPSERTSGHASDYDILVITRSVSAAGDDMLWNEINEQLVRMPHFSTYARVIIYDIESFNQRLRDGRYFYVDIVEEGRILYDSGRAKLAEPKTLSREERLRIAQEYYDHWSERAAAYYRHYEYACRDKDWRMAAFNLHQATEAAYKMVLLVRTGYSPDEHYLALLGSLAEREDPQLAGIFPRQTAEQQERFRLLEYAYIGARYDKNYRISAEDLGELATHVRDLLGRADGACKKALSD